MRAAVGEPAQPIAVGRVMNNIPPATPEPPERIGTEDARAGRTGNKVRYVLAISVILAAIFMVVAFFGSPDAPADRPNSAAEANRG